MTLKYPLGTDSCGLFIPPQVRSHGSLNLPPNFLNNFLNFSPYVSILYLDQ